jgi:hypothetical protein
MVRESDPAPLQSYLFAGFPRAYLAMYAQRSDQRFFLPVFVATAQVGDQGGRRVPARPHWISVRGY